MTRFFGHDGEFSTQIFAERRHVWRQYVTPGTGGNNNNNNSYSGL